MPSWLTPHGWGGVYADLWGLPNNAPPGAVNHGWSNVFAALRHGKTAPRASRRR